MPETAIVTVSVLRISGEELSDRSDLQPKLEAVPITRISAVRDLMSSTFLVCA